MTKRMLIDASHAEETRVVVLDGNRLEDFDVETSTKRQLKGNIYLAKVVRVEPSLQAAFVEYGGNRHGFLAFSEIHPDYYQIPVADRQRLIEMEAEEARREEEEEDRAAGHGPDQSDARQSQPAATTQTAKRQPPAKPTPAAPAPAGQEESPVAETTDESGATIAMLQEGTPSAAISPEPVANTTEVEPAAGTPVPAVAETADESGATIAIFPAQPGAAEQESTTAAEAPQPDVRPVLPEAETSDESGAVVTMFPGAPATGPARPEALDQAAPSPEPPAAETSDESGAPQPMLQAEPSVPAPDATVEASPASPADPVAPPAAEGFDGSAATDPDSDDDEPPTRGRPRAQPLVIEPDTLSGPLESGDESEDASGDAESPAIAETSDESGATVAMLSDVRAAGGESRPRDGSGRRARQRPQPTDEAAADEETDINDAVPESPPPETVGGDHDNDERSERRIPPRFLRNYKIQEVIRRRQIMLVQVVKEERGTKGAALTTYLSLAGRFSVLMPNSPRGGGISRKITSATDRRRLKEAVAEMELPKGMGLIVRTAGANRPKPEIKRDCEYLLRLWDDIREHTLKSVAPALIYEEASLIKRAIRDVYSRDIDEIQVDGENGWRAAHDFMRMLMPSHAKKVQLWRDGGQPLFARYQVEAQLDSMLLPTVQLRSGGYLVINQTEALVAIDVNSGRSTRERNVEETALRTNLEAADEAARQLRLRDLAGLIVIDFIDMESKKHNAMVERRLKEALKNDRARIQVGHISHFGLLEMSRQRLRPSLAETSFIPCPHCGGMGHVRSTESAALHVLRGIEEEGSKRRAAEIVVHVATPIALYILNHKRDRLQEIELRYGMRVTLAGDDRQIEPQYRIDRLRPQLAGATPAVITPDLPQPALLPPEPEVEEEEAPPVLDEEIEVEAEETVEAADEARPEGGEGSAEDEAERRRRRRRRRRRGRREDAGAVDGQSEEAAAVEALPVEPAESGDMVEAVSVPAAEAEVPTEPATAEADMPAEIHIEGVPEHVEATAGEEDDGRSRRRGRRGGRRRRREAGEADAAVAAPGAEQPDLPSYTGPTPANPFGGHAFDIFDMLEQAEGFLSGGAPQAGGSLGATAPVTITTEPEPALTVAPEQGPQAERPSEPIQQLEILNTTAAEPVGEEPLAQPLEAMPPATDTPVEPASSQAAVDESHGLQPLSAEPRESGSATASAEGERPVAEPVSQPVNAWDAAATTAGVDEAPASAEAPPAAAESPVDASAMPAEPPAETAAAAGEAVPAEASAELAPAELPAVAEEPAAAEPAVKPIVIGDPAEPPVQPKRGWWRR